MTIKFKIENLTCEACIKLSRSMLGKIKGVKNVSLSGLDGIAEITADREITIDEIQDSFEGTDFKVISL